MKINKIYIKNINSLRGEHLIDFTASPLAESGIFAIAGPTGSGKSTILDAILLAIYNRVPRLGGAQVSKNMVEERGAILSQNAAEAVAEVEYSCASGVFATRWEISHNRNKRLRDYDMRLRDAVTGATLVEKKSEVVERNAQLIGLSYDQFIRSMMLPQGEFALFLKSGKNERGKLLEKITGQSLYTELGRSAFERNKILAAATADLQRRLDDLASLRLADDAHAALEADFARCDAQAAALAKERDELQRVVDQKKNAERLAAEAAEARKAVALARDEAERFRAQNSDPMRRHAELAPHVDDLTALVEAKKRADLAKVRLMETENQARRAADQAERAGQAIVKFTQGDIAPGAGLVENLAAFAEKFRLKKSEIDKVGGDYSLVFQKVGFVAREVGIEVQKKDAPNDVQQRFSERRKALLDEMRQIEALWPEVGTADLRQLVAALDARQKLVEEWSKTLEKSELKSAELAAAQAEAVRRADQRAQLSAELAREEPLLRELDLRTQLKQKEIEIGQLTRSLDEHRHRLKPGEPCPLCGSLDHPAAGVPSPDVAAAERELAQMRDGLARASKRVGELKARVAVIDDETASRRQAEETLRAEAAQLAATAAAASQKAGAKEADTPASLGQSLKNQSEAALRYIRANDDSEKINGLKEELSRLMELYAAGRALRDQVGKLYQGADFERDAERLRADFTKAESEMERLQRNAADQRADIAAQATSNAAAEARLAPALAALGYATTAAAHAALLPRADYDRLRAAEAQLAQKLQINKAKVETIEAHIAAVALPDDAAEAEQRLQIAATQIAQNAARRDELLERRSNQNRIRQEHSDLLEQKAEHDKRSRRWKVLNDLIGDAQGAKFNDFAQNVTLSQLVRLANHRLAALTGRYQLRFSAFDGDKQFFVEDRDMGGARRAAESLSGGETFLVSLSLALALSDLASRNVPIESLFIDEGFGSLDPEALDMAISALEGIQASGDKSIGVISHVDALKERISAKVELRPDPGRGCSRVVVCRN